MKHGALVVLCFLILLIALAPTRSLAAIGRTVDAKADFGAVGNGINDDTVALQNALNYLSTNLITDAGVCLYLPAGTYKITNQLTFVAATNAVAGDFQGIMIRGNGKDGPDATVISSTGTNGAVRFNVNDDFILYNFKIQIQDLQFKAGVANAGAAIEIAKLTGTNDSLRTTPWLRNVVITRADTNCYFTYGFKGSSILRPIFDNVSITGNRPGMIAGILLDFHYGYDVAGCFISDANVAVDSKDGGEGNSTADTTLTNVNIGVRMNVEKPVVSSSGGGIINSYISAHQIGVCIDKKNFATFHNSTFSSCGGSGPYTNIYALEFRQSTISDCTFVGGSNQVGIVMAEDRADINSQNTIAYNQFGSFDTSILIDTNVSLTKIIDNSNIQSNIVDNGIDTYIVHGSPRPFYDSPAAHRTDEDLQWNSIATNYGSVINVTNYGAKGDGVTDDTTALTNAVAALKTSLDNTGKGALYFPAGRYRTSKQLVLTQSGANWQKMAIFGDGSQVSVIEKTSGVSGILKITCTSQVPTRVHNIRLSPIQLNSGTAFELVQQNGTNDGPRSLIMHDVLLTGSGNGFFTTAIVGQGLVRPLFQSCWSDSGGKAGSSGMKISGGYGFDWQGGKFGDMDDTAGSIDSLGGAVTIRGPGFCAGLSTRTGLTVNANGGTFSLYRAHINAINCLVVSNASAASFALTETLWGAAGYDGPSSSLRFSNCTNIVVRDASLYSAAGTNRPLNTFILLEGNNNRDVDISGNMLRFSDYEGTGINIAQGTLNASVYDNRFFNLPAIDIVNDEPTASIALLPMEYRPELAGYWDLEEGTNSTVRGRNYLQQGLISGASWAAGKYGTGLIFDGINDSVTMEHPQFAELMTNFTMMVWVKPAKAITGDNQGGGQSYVISGSSPDTNANHTAVNLSVGTNGIRVVENGATHAPTRIDWAGTVSSTTWTHVAVTYSNSVPRLYVNGILTATGGASSGTVPHPGGSSWGGNEWGWYQGSMDEVRVFDRPLSTTEINVEANGSLCDFNGSQATASAFTTAADWDGSAFPANDLITNIARFNKTSYANQPTNVNYSLNGLIFGDGMTATADTTITISGQAGQQLKLGNSGIVMNPNAGKATINKIQLGADQSWVNNSTNILSVGTLGNLSSNTPYTVTLTGTGPISITGAASDNGAGTTAIRVSGVAVTLSGAGTYTGGTTVSAGTLTGTSSGALGAGNVTVADGATLILQNSAAVHTGAELVLGNSSSLTLSFTGSDKIGHLSLDGGVTWLTNGTYNAASLDALGTGTYTGSGSLDVGYHTLNGSAAGNGTVSPASTNVLFGDSATFVITASNYYRIASLSTNGTDTGETFDNNSTVTNFIWSNVQSAGTLVATFTAQVTADPASTPYWWMAQYGLTNFSTDAMADADEDGLVTWQEYVAGTDPTNPASAFQINGGSVTAQAVIIRWSSVSNRFYDVSRTTNLMEAFAAVTDATNLPATPPENAYTNSQNSDSAFYKISAHP
jgi:autotransporter-associated beta strand protein